MIFSNLNKSIKIILPIFLGVFLMYYSSLQVSFKEILVYFKKADLVFVLLGVFLMLLSHLSRAYRWVLVLKEIGYNVSFFNSTMAIFSGYLVNYIFPRAGEFVRATSITNYEKVPFNKSMGSIISERIADVLMLFDSWSHMIPNNFFKQCGINPTAKIVNILRSKDISKPIIGFPFKAGSSLINYSYESNVDCLALDWTVDLNWAKKNINSSIAIQGNLDPASLIPNKSIFLEKNVLSILDINCELFRIENNLYFNLTGGQPSDDLTLSRSQVLTKDIGGENTHFHVYLDMSDEASAEHEAAAAFIFTGTGALVIHLPVTKSGLRRRCEESAAIEGETVSRFVFPLVRHLAPDEPILTSSERDFRHTFDALLGALRLQQMGFRRVWQTPGERWPFAGVGIAIGRCGGGAERRRGLKYGPRGPPGEGPRRRRGPGAARGRQEPAAVAGGGRGARGAVARSRALTRGGAPPVAGVGGGGL